MLPAEIRLRRSQDFAAVIRSGSRGGSRRLVVHLLTGVPARVGPARAGFVVPATVGNSVVRHRITRQLRPLVRELLPTLPAGTDMVVRALPPAAGASSTELAGDLAVGLRTAARRAGRGAGR